MTIETALKVVVASVRDVGFPAATALLLLWAFLTRVPTQEQFASLSYALTANTQMVVHLVDQQNRLIEMLAAHQMGIIGK